MSAELRRCLRAAGGRPLLTRIGHWQVRSDRIKSLIAAANRPGLNLIRFVELPSSRTEIIEPTPPSRPYAFTDPLSHPSYSWHLYAVGANQIPTAGAGFPVTVFDSGLDAAHPDFAGRPDTLMLNPQTVAFTPEDYHGTMVSSVAAAALTALEQRGSTPVPRCEATTSTMRPGNRTLGGSRQPFRRGRV